MEVSTAKQVRDSLGEMEIQDWLIRLALPVGGWKIFHTATFRPCSPARSPWSALNRYRHYMQERDRRKVTWVVGIERNPDHHALNPGYHCHAMWAATDEVWRTTSFKRWAEQWGNNKVEAVRVKEHVQRYVSKYCLKESGLWDLEINDPTIWRQQQLGLRGKAA